MIEVGRVAVKLAGRDAGKKCIVVDVVEGGFVLIDGETRRRECNPKHLEILEHKVEITKGASTDDLKSVFKELGFSVHTTKPKQAGPKPVRQRTIKEKKPKKVVEGAPKKAAKKTTKKTTTKKSVKTDPAKEGSAADSKKGVDESGHAAKANVKPTSPTQQKNV